MKLKSEELNQEETQVPSTNALYKKIIKERLIFIEESFRVIRDALDHLETEDEGND